MQRINCKAPYLFPAMLALLLLHLELAFGQASTLNQNCRQNNFSCGECESNLQEGLNKILAQYLGSGNLPNSNGRWNTATLDPANASLKPGATIEDFLADVTKLMKEQNTGAPGKLNMIAIGRSDSVHTTSPGFPRIALKSPDGELWVTFNTDPTSPAFNKVEIMRWDGQKGRYQFQEVEFAPRGATGPHATGHMDLTGQKCAVCHRSPDPRANWDTYRAWAGIIPPRDDMLETTTPPGNNLPTPEGGPKLDGNALAYFNLLDKIAAARASDAPNRLKSLEIPYDGDPSLSDAEKIAKIKAEILKNGYYRVPHYPDRDKTRHYSSKTAPKAGSSHVAFDQLMGQQMCQVARILSENPKFPQFKYAVAGLIFCEGNRVNADRLAEYMPPELRRKADEFFSNALGQQSSYDQVYEDTKRQHSLGDQYKTERESQFLRRYLTEAEQWSSSDVEAEVNRTANAFSSVGYPYTAISDPGGVRGVAESDTPMVSGMRYLLEPLGIRVNDWSMQMGKNLADGGTYAFSDQFRSIIELQEQLKKPYNEAGQDCGKLKELSRQAFATSYDSHGRISPRVSICNVLIGDRKFTVPPANAPSNIRENFREQNFRRVGSEVLHVCMECHSEKTNDGYITVFPFDKSENEIKIWLNSQNDKREFVDGQARRRTRWIETMRSALHPQHFRQLSPPLPGVMPPGGWPRNMDADLDSKEHAAKDDLRRKIAIDYLNILAGEPLAPDSTAKIDCSKDESKSMIKTNELEELNQTGRSGE